MHNPINQFHRYLQLEEACLNCKCSIFHRNTRAAPGLISSSVTHLYGSRNISTIAFYFSSQLHPLALSCPVTFPQFSCHLSDCPFAAHFFPSSYSGNLPSITLFKLSFACLPLTSYLADTRLVGPPQLSSHPIKYRSRNSQSLATFLLTSSFPPSTRVCHSCLPVQTTGHTNGRAFRSATVCCVRPINKTHNWIGYVTATDTASTPVNN